MTWFRTFILLATSGCLLVGCATDGGSERTDQPSKTSESATVVVESVVGDRVSVDGRPRSGVPPGQQFELAAGTYALAVGGQVAGWSRPNVVEIQAGELNVTRIPWKKLPVGDRLQIELPARKTVERLEESDALEFDGGALGQKTFETFATYRSGESVSGSYVEIVDPKGMVRDGLGFRDGDRLFTVDGTSVDSITPLVDALGAYYSDEGDLPQWTLLRDGRKVVVEATLRKLPSDALKGIDDAESNGGDSRSGSDDPDRARVTVYAKPKGIIVVDGEATGKETPSTVMVSPGEHDVSVDFGDEHSEVKRVRARVGNPLKLFFRQNE